MSTSTAWREQSYNEAFDATLASLRRRRDEDPSFGIAQLRSLLNNLYVNDGNDWGGRGELQDLLMQATLDAHESLLAEMEAQQGPAGES